MRYSRILDKISYHAVYDESIMAALGYARGNEFTGVQIAVESPHLSFERLSESDCDEIAEFAVSNGLRLAIHAPDESVSLSETSEYLLRGTFDYFESLFAFAEQISCRLITVHLGSATVFPTDTMPRQAIPEIDAIWHRLALRNNLQQLVDLADGRFTICVENYRMEDAILDLLQPYLDTGQLSLCWDLAKMFDGRGNLNRRLEQYMLSNIQHVSQVHLHDIAEGTSHRTIGSGDLDFVHYLTLLSEVDVTDYCIEVRPREKAKESLVNLKNLVLYGSATDEPTQARARTLAHVA